MSSNRKLTAEARRLMLLDMQRAHELVTERKYDEVKRIVENVASGLAWAGAKSAHVTWARAVIADYEGDGDAAFQFIMEAAEMDPLEPGVVRSFDIITEKLRRTLIDPDHDPANEAMPRLHDMLVQAGKADDLVHIAMARLLEAIGKGEEALKLLDAVLLLSPACRDAWAAKSIVAKNLGLNEVALAAEAEVAALDGVGPVPLFGTPCAKAVA